MLEWLYLHNNPIRVNCIGEVRVYACLKTIPNRWCYHGNPNISLPECVPKYFVRVFILQGPTVEDDAVQLLVQMDRITVYKNLDMNILDCVVVKTLTFSIVLGSG